MRPRPNSRTAFALIAMGLLLPAAGALEVATRGEADGDNPAESLRYLQQHGQFYAMSGICLLLVAFGLLAAATTFSLRSHFTMAVGTVGGAMLLLVGALRMSSPGPIDYISEMDPEWGEGAYLVVQMAGTQGALPAGMVAAAVWAASVSVIGRRARLLPLPVVILGFVPLLYPVTAMLSIVTGGTDSSAAWVASVVALFLGLPLWCLSAGVTLLTRSARPADVRPRTAEGALP